MCLCFLSLLPNPDIKPHQYASASLVSCPAQTSNHRNVLVPGSRTCWFGLRSILRGETIIAAPLLLLLNLELINFAFETLTPPCSCYWTNPAKLTRSGRACLKAGTAASTERQAQTWACVREEVFFAAQVYIRLDRNIVKGTMHVGVTGFRNLTRHMNTNINMNINTTTNETNCPS